MDLWFSDADQIFQLSSNFTIGCQAYPIVLVSFSVQNYSEKNFLLLKLNFVSVLQWKPQSISNGYLTRFWQILPESCKIMHNLARFLPESCKITIFLPESCKITIFLTESCKIIIFLPESCKITIFLPESCKITIFLPESCKITIFMPESCKITIFLPESCKITIFLPESCKIAIFMLESYKIFISLSESPTISSFLHKILQDGLINASNSDSKRYSQKLF